MEAFLRHEKTKTPDDKTRAINRSLGAVLTTQKMTTEERSSHLGYSKLKTREVPIDKQPAHRYKYLSSWMVAAFNTKRRNPQKLKHWKIFHHQYPMKDEQKEEETQEITVTKHVCIVQK